MSKQTEQIILIAVVALVAFKFLAKASPQVVAVSSGGTSFDIGGDLSDAFGIASDFD